MSFIKFEQHIARENKENERNERSKNSICDLAEKEADILKKTGEFLEKTPRNLFHNKKIKTVVAFSLLLELSTLFSKMAWAREARENCLPQKDDPQIKSLLKEPPKFPIDWKKIVDEISLTIEHPSIDKEMGEAVEEVGFLYSGGERRFYRDMSEKEKHSSISLLYDDIVFSSNFQQFFNYIEANGADFNAKQKIYFLRQLGYELARAQKKKKSADEQYRQLSDEEMFDLLKDIYPARQCGNIHPFMAKVAAALDLEAWLQDGYKDYGGHAWMGTIVNNEIVFIDNGEIVATGTLDYEKALGVMERRNKEIALLQSYCGNAEEVLFPTKSRAQKILEDAAGMRGSGERLSDDLEAGANKRKKTLEISIDQEKKEINFTRNSIALGFINYQDAGDPYNSLESLNAARGGLRYKRGNLTIESSAAYMHLNVKNLGAEIFPRELIAGILAGDYIKTARLAQGKIGKLNLHLGAAVEIGIAHFLEQEKSLSKTEGSGDGSAGLRLIFINPEETGKIYLEAQETAGAMLNNYGDQDMVIRKTAEKIAAGVSFKVNQMNLINLEAALSELRHGRNYLLTAGVKRDKLKSELSYLQEISDYEHLAPSKRLVQGSFGYQIAPEKSKGPLGEINVFGALGEERYGEETDFDKITNIGLKLRIFIH